MNFERILRNPKFLILAAVGVALFLARDTVASEISYAVSDKNRYDTLFSLWGDHYGVSPALLKAFFLHESRGGTMPSVVWGLSHPDDAEGSKAESDGLSYGIMQITPDTANRPRVKSRFGRTATIRDLNTPNTAIQLAALIISELENFYFKDDLGGVIRAYNGGPGWRTNAAKNVNLAASLDDYFQRVFSFYQSITRDQPNLA
jgi:soluble lytic murein transglycosylase-like protein